MDHSLQMHTCASISCRAVTQQLLLTGHRWLLLCCINTATSKPSKPCAVHVEQLAAVNITHKAKLWVDLIPSTACPARADAADLHATCTVVVGLLNCRQQLASYIMLLLQDNCTCHYRCIMGTLGHANCLNTC
jgi:hypothetical protein